MSRRKHPLWLGIDDREVWRGDYWGNHLSNSVVTSSWPLRLG